MRRALAQQRSKSNRGIVEAVGRYASADRTLLHSRGSRRYPRADSKTQSVGKSIKVERKVIPRWVTIPDRVQGRFSGVCV